MFIQLMFLSLIFIIETHRERKTEQACEYTADFFAREWKKTTGMQLDGILMSEYF